MKPSAPPILALILVLLALVAPQAGRAADEAGFAQAVRALNADSFSDKIAAARALAATGDPRAAALLSALADGTLQALPDGEILTGDGTGYRDAVDGHAVAPAAADLAPIMVNNRVRSVVRGLLSILDLSSPDRDARARAVATIDDQADPGSADLLRAALARETDPALRQKMSRVLAGLDLASPDRARRLVAVRILADSTDREAENRLATLLTHETDPAVKAAATKTMASIHRALALIDAGVTLFQGLSLGSVLLLAAIGLAITFGVMGVINMAHGEMIMLGAYATVVVQDAFRALAPPAWFDAYLVVALPVAFLVTALVGIVLERCVIRFLYGRPLETLLATFGISLILQQAVRTLFGAPNKEVANPAWMTGGITLAGDVTLTWNRIVILAFCLIVLTGLAALLRWSAFGLHMRAVAQNRAMAAAMGIRTGRVDAMTFGLGSGIAGIAGVALSQIGNVSPNLGQGYIVDSFMVVVFGGVGSLWGTLVGAFGLGILNKVLEPLAGAMLGKVLVLVLIILFIQKRPRGLFALKGRSIES